MLRAETAVAFETKAIEMQRSHIEKLREDGQHSEQAEHVLKILEVSLDVLKHNRDMAQAQVDHLCEAGAVQRKR